MANGALHMINLPGEILEVCIELIEICADVETPRPGRAASDILRCAITLGGLAADHPLSSQILEAHAELKKWRELEADYRGAKSEEARENLYGLIEKACREIHPWPSS